MPAIPIRQWVISFPKRIRHYLQTNAILKEVLHVVVDEIKKKVSEEWAIHLFVLSGLSTSGARTSEFTPQKERVVLQNFDLLYNCLYKYIKIAYIN